MEKHDRMQFGRENLGSPESMHQSSTTPVRLPHGNTNLKLRKELVLIKKSRNSGFASTESELEDA